MGVYVCMCVWVGGLVLRPSSECCPLKLSCNALSLSIFEHIPCRGPVCSIYSNQEWTLCVFQQLQESHRALVTVRLKPKIKVNVEKVMKNCSPLLYFCKGPI